MSSEEDRNQRNLQDVLRLAVSNTPHNSEIETATSSRPTAMDAERREFLDKVLSDISSSGVKDMQKRLELLQNNINLVSSGDSTAETFAEMECTLECLTDISSQIDHANDFHKIGGFTVLESLLNLEHEGILCNTADLIAELVQNNPYCQKAALQSAFVNKMLNLLDCNENPNVKIKALYALSCLVRQNHEAQDIFEKNDGFSVLLRAMQGTVLKLRIKISFLLASLCNDRSEYLDILYKMGFVDQLAALLHSERDESHEHLLSALLGLVSQHLPSAQECRKEELGLQDLIKERIRELRGQEAHQDEYNYCLKLLDTCFATSLSDQEMER